MAGIKDDSTIAASNDGLGLFDENQATSSVNNGGRQGMADIRGWYESVEFRDLGDTPTQTAATTFTLVGDQTAVYTTNTAIKCTDATTLYGWIVSSSFSAVTTVTVVLDSGSLSASLTAVSIGLEATHPGLPRQTTAQFNALNSDQNFATLAGTETLTNKTINMASNTITGTAAEFNAAISDDDFVGADDVVTFTNKTFNQNIQFTSAGQGLDFSGNTHAAGMTSEEFVWYEEGTWTPELWDTTLATDPTPPTYVANLGRYTRIGRVVYLEGNITISALGTLTAGDEAYIGGLPFTPDNASGAITIGMAGGLAITATTSLTGSVNTGGYIDLLVWDATTGTTAALISDLSATMGISFSGFYSV